MEKSNGDGVSVDTIFTKVWTRRLAQFALGFFVSAVLFFLFSGLRWTEMALAVVWPASVISSYLPRLWDDDTIELLGIAIYFLVNGTFWGLVLVALGWGWDEWKKRRKA